MASADIENLLEQVKGKNVGELLATAQAAGIPVGALTTDALTNKAQEFRLKMIRRACKMIETYTSAVAAFFLLVAGITIVADKALWLVSLSLVDISVLLIGVFLGVATVDRILRLSIGAGVPKVKAQTAPVTLTGQAAENAGAAGALIGAFAEKLESAPVTETSQAA